MTSTFDRLNATLVSNYQIDPESVTLDANFASLDMDSLDVAEMLFTIEDKFKVTFPVEPEHMPTVGDVVRYIDQLIAAQDHCDTPINMSVAPVLQTS
jgi:acyl carrier protein